MIVRVAKIQTLTILNSGENMKQQRLLNCQWNAKYSLFGKQLLYTKLNIVLSYHPVITLFDIYQKELKIYVHTKTCIHMFIAVFFIIAKTWKRSDVLQ